MNSLHLIYIGFCSILLVLPLLTVKNATRFIYIVGIVLFFFISKLFIMILNERLGYFSPKDAGNYSLYLYTDYKRYTSIFGFTTLKDLLKSTFFIQFVLNYLPFELCGPNRMTLLISNCFYTSLASVFSYIGLYRVTNSKGALGVLLLLSLYPASVNFSIFGLRDAIIYFFVVVNAISFVYLICHKYTISFVCASVSALAIVSLRIEILPVVLLPYSIYIALNMKRFIGRFRLFDERIFLYVLFSFIFCGILVNGMPKFYGLIVSQVGITESVSIGEVIDISAVSRYNRTLRADGGSGSNIVPPQLYHSLPWYGKWSLQSVGIVVLPFPWMINSLLKFVSFIDSLYIIGMIIYYLRRRKLGRRLLDESRKEFYLLFLAFVFGVAFLGIMVSNAGNAFRMRLSIVPYLIIVVAFVSTFPVRSYIGNIKL